MIIRLTADQLRKLAGQLEAYRELKTSGAAHPSSNTVLAVDGVALAYLHWWDSAEAFTAEFIDFTPGSAVPLAYHETQEEKR